MTTFEQDAATVRELCNKHFQPLEGNPESDARRLYSRLPPGRVSTSMLADFTSAHNLPTNHRYQRAFRNAMTLQRMAEFENMTLDEKRAYVAKHIA